MGLIVYVTGCGENCLGFNKGQILRCSLVRKDECMNSILLRIKSKLKLPSRSVHDRSKQDTDVSA